MRTASRTIVLFVIGLCQFLSIYAQTFSDKEISRWKKQAESITILRDTWGIAHVYGNTDADAVFGLLYAQCEDDFKRVEMNYITAMGRVAEVEGEAKIFHDLRMRLFYDTVQAKGWYAQSPPWLKELCNSFADGVNYYLQTHPQTKPQLINRFEPWMPLLFSEGSIGGNIEAISVQRVKSFYDQTRSKQSSEVPDLDGGLPPEPRGSNGFAIAPSRTLNGNALFLINPHTSFYFRPEVHVNSEEGLHAYGAVTWGQFFVYQGFNEHCGWMHTTSAADAIDEYEETIVKKGNDYFSKSGTSEIPVKTKQILIGYKNGDRKAVRAFTAFETKHGPVIDRVGEKWISVSMMKEPIKALSQSFMRTKSKDLASFRQSMELRTNSSNNTVYADDKGNIAYWHGNFVPVRDPKFDWTKPVDGSNPANDWKGLHELSQIVQIVNPENGWIQNCNSTPFTVSGPKSPKQSNYAKYMAPDEENPRGINAQRVLDRETRFTLDKLISAAYDPHLVAFDQLIPNLLKAFDGASQLSADTRQQLAEPIEVLRQWDRNWSEKSVATTLAIYWGQEVARKAIRQSKVALGILPLLNFVCDSVSQADKLTSLQEVVNELSQDYGTWKVEWGTVNRYQRLTGNIEETYDDQKESLPVPFASSYWGSLASFGSKKFPGTKKMYGYGGNSFVAAVEFGPRIKAKSVLAGGNSANPASPYFTNQAENYSQGTFKDVLFYRDDIEAHLIRAYQPGK